MVAPAPLPSAVDGREIRAAIRSAAVRGGASGDRAQDLTLAAWEAVCNTIEHGGSRPELTIGGGRDRVTVVIPDPGAARVDRDGRGWSTPDPDPWAPRGRGWRIIVALVDEVRIVDADGVVYLELTIRLPG